MRILVPQLGESVAEAEVAKIMKKIGDHIQSGEIIILLETDKVTLEIAAPETGFLEELAVREGDSVKNGDLLAVLSSGQASSKSASASDLPESNTTIIEDKKQQPKAEVYNSPAAEKLIRENHLSKNNIIGSGKDGRITKEDVLSVLKKDSSNINANNASSVISIDDSKNGERRVRMSKLRQKVAVTLKEAQNNAAMLTTFNEVDMSRIMEIRKSYKDDFEKKHGSKLGFMSFFVKAVVQSLEEFPDVNASIDGTDIVYHNYCNIGVAIGAEQGLVVPVVKNAQKMDMHDIEKSIVNFANLAKTGKLSIDDLRGGTFTVTNGGIYGSLMSTPILNYPQSAILGMHKIQDRPVVVNGQIVIRPMMYIALSYDHRIIDGKEAVTFLATVKACVENPERMLMKI